MSDEALDVKIADDKERRCLSCTELFLSHWAGERICVRCKQTSAWRSGVAYKKS